MTAAILAAPTGRHHRPPLHRRLLGRLHARRVRREHDAAADNAWIVRVEAHAPPPLAQAQARVAALYGALHHEHAGMALPPLPPAMQDVEAKRPWELETGQFPKIIDAMGDER